MFLSLIRINILNSAKIVRICLIYSPLRLLLKNKEKPGVVFLTPSCLRLLCPDLKTMSVIFTESVLLAETNENRDEEFD